MIDIPLTLNLVLVIKTTIEYQNLLLVMHFNIVNLNKFLLAKCLDPSFQKILNFQIFCCLFYLSQMMFFIVFYEECRGFLTKA